MYGTRGCQSDYSGSLIDTGFAQGTSWACVLRHDQRQIMVSVHCDDFTCSGARPQLQWLETEMRAKYELTVKRDLGQAMMTTITRAWYSTASCVGRVQGSSMKLILDKLKSSSDTPSSKEPMQLRHPALSRCRTSSSRSNHCRSLPVRGSEAKRLVQTT